MIDYRISANAYGYQYATTTNRLNRPFIAAAAIYGSAAGIGYLVGGPPGAVAGMVAVPEVLVVPILLTM